MINTFDIDGVINMGQYTGLRPASWDVIITGRSREEKSYTYSWLHSLGIYNTVFFNEDVTFEGKTREKSGEHKAKTINMLLARGIQIGLHFEDDPVQADIIERDTPVRVVRIIHDLVEKENVWHGPTNNTTGAESN